MTGLALHVGPAGWSYADWNGVVYPRRKERAFHPLAHLARFVSCVELNGTFYGVPDPEHARTWARLVEDRPDFRFTAKIHRAFTHEARLPRAEHARLLQAFRDGLNPLCEASRLTALLAQFPFSFRPSREAFLRLERIAEDFAPLPLVLEVRHRDWYAPEPLRVIERAGYSLACIDLPAARDHPPPLPASNSHADSHSDSHVNPPRSGPLGYLRLHGRNAKAWFDRQAGRDQRYDYLYTPDELQGLVSIARRLASGVDETFVITNNHFSGKAVANALELMAALDGVPPLAPIELVEAFPRLRASVRIAGQATLF